MVSASLVDGRATMASFGWRLYQVEVHHSPLAPIMGLDRLWRRFDRLDTVPHIRSLGTVAVIGDTQVIGIGGSSATVWSYDVRTKEMTRSPSPDWFNTAWVTPPPAFSPDGRFIAYVSQDDASRLTVRSWPGGRIVVQSPPIQLQQRNGADHRGGSIIWSNPTFVNAYLPVLDSGPSMAWFSGRVRGDTMDVESWKIWPDPEAMAERERERAAPAPPVQSDSAIQARFDSAARAVVSLAPSAFSELPAPFVRQLTRAGCGIPQSQPGSRPQNVVHGTFGAPQQLDWAVLCLRNTESSIRIWWGGPARCPGEINPGTNRSFLEMDANRIVFARLLTTTDFYHDYANADSTGAPRVVKLEHDAIVDSFSDKYATILVCRGGRWVSLSGVGE